MLVFFYSNDDKYVSHVFMFISGKYMVRVFMYKWKIYLWVSDHRLWSATTVVLSEVCVDSIVVAGFVQRRRCLIELWCWRDYELVSVWFLLFYFHFCLLAFVFVLFRGNEDGWWLCLKILNLVFWIEGMSYLVLTLFCWMHISIQHDWFYLDVARKR